MTNVIPLNQCVPVPARNRPLIIDISLPLYDDVEYREEEQQALFWSLEKFAGNYHPEVPSPLQRLVEGILGLPLQTFHAAAGEGVVDGRFGFSDIEIDLESSLLADGRKLGLILTGELLSKLIKAVEVRFPQAVVTDTTPPAPSAAISVLPVESAREALS